MLWTVLWFGIEDIGDLKQDRESEICTIIIFCVQHSLYRGFKEISALFFLHLNFFVTFSSPSITMKFLVFAFILILTLLYFHFQCRLGWLQFCFGVALCCGPPKSSDGGI